MAADVVPSLYKSCGCRPLWMKADDLLCCSKLTLPSFSHCVFHLLLLIPLLISSCITGRPQNDPSLLLSWTEYMSCGTGNLRSGIIPINSCTTAAPHQHEDVSLACLAVSSSLQHCRIRHPHTKVVSPPIITAGGHRSCIGFR